jgi:hypothetical protein
LNASKQQSLGRRFIVPAFSAGCCISDCITREETIESSLGSLSDVFPSAIASDAVVTFIEDEELDLQPASAPAATRPNVTAAAHVTTKPKSNFNLIVIIAVLLAIAVKCML